MDGQDRRAGRLPCRRQFEIACRSDGLQACTFNYAGHWRREFPMKPEASRTGLICPITGATCEHRECKKGQFCVAERERREAAAVLQLEAATAAAREERL